MTTDLLTLIGASVDLKKTASTNGGEYHGACPFCGGRDRLAVWPNASRPAWWCRMCERGGDAIQYLREQGHTFAEACQLLGVVRDLPQVRPLTPPVPCEAPSKAWRAAAGSLVFWAQQRLDGAALDYLHARGLSDRTIAAAGLGYNPTGRWCERAKWGLDVAKGDDPRFWLPQGIVIPTRIGGELWKLQVRRDVVKDGQDRYKTLPGSANALYNADAIQPSRPAALVEGPFDALAVEQAAGDLIGAAASGTSGARRARWVGALALAPQVLVSLDADAAGDEASGWWLRVLDGAKRWRPYYADPAQMLQDGQDVRAWVLAGLGKRAMTFVPEFAEFWRDALEHNWTEHLDRLRLICAEQSADYDATVASLKN